VDELIERPEFAVSVSDRGAFVVHMESLRQEFTVATNVAGISAEEKDCTLSAPLRSAHRDFDRFTWSAASPSREKVYTLDIYRTYMAFGVQVFGGPPVDTLEIFSGSTISFTTVASPEPCYDFRAEFPPTDYAEISVHGNGGFRGGNFVTNPSMFCYALGSSSRDGWLGVGLAADPGGYNFSTFEYCGGATFSVALRSWGITAPERIRPSVFLTPGSSAADVFRTYVSALRERGLVEGRSVDQADWWTRPMIGGWGHQCYQADLWRIRSPADRPPDNSAYTLCTQVNYADIVAAADARELPWGTLVIDARWFMASGLRDVDPGRWPSMREFIESLHRRGKRVLLWWGPWDVGGIAAAECVRLSGASAEAKNDQVRLQKFGSPPQKLAVDISLPSVRARIRKQLVDALSPEGLGADGLKIDHVAAAPGHYGMEFPDGSSRVFGVEATRLHLELLFESAKDIKPDALIIGQSPNPYLVPFQDAIRIGIGTPDTSTVVPEARFAASMAKIVDPTWLVDTNGWAIPTLEAFREYARVQPTLGIPALHYATHLDQSGQELDDASFRILRESWRGYD
jgi:hypothetical protein